MFLSFRKNRETKYISVQISKKFQRASVSLLKMCKIKNICNVVEFPKNVRNFTTVIWNLKKGKELK